MAPEIADSDDEGDLQVRPANHKVPTAHEPNTVVAEFAEMAEPDPLLNVDFETYCSPTQHLSDFDVDQYNTQRDSDLGSSALIDSSTNRFLNEVAPIASSYEAATHKRTNSSASEMGGKGSASKAGHKRTRSQAIDSALSNQDGNAKKKARTYGSSNTSDATQDLATFNNGIGLNSSDMVSVEPRTQYTPDTTSLLSPFEAGNDKGRSSRNQMYGGPQASTRNGSFYNIQGGMANYNSMSNYQGYTLDRSALEGNFNEINPFGQPSQADEEDDVLAKIFKSKSASRQSTSQDAVDGIMREMQTSPIKSDPTVAPEQPITQPELPSASPPFSPITNPDENPSLEAVVHEDVLGDVIEIQPTEDVLAPSEVQGGAKKRGRKPKQKNSDNTKVSEHDEAGVTHVDDHQFGRKDRADTVDSVSNMSEISQVTSASKSGRKRKSKKKAEPAPGELSKKLPSSDLGLDSKAVIGFSPERYVPRPSRRRGHAEPEPVPEASDSIGVDLESVQQNPPPKGKKGRKGRGKKAAPVEDVAVLESMSGVIVSDEDKNGGIQPPEQLEDPAALVEEDEAEDEMPKSASRRTKITIDVPILPKPQEEAVLPPVVPEPKKRGRKKKGQVEISVDEAAAPTEEKDERLALAERDSNIQSKKHLSTKINPEVEIIAKEEDEEIVERKSVMPVTPSSNMSAATPNSKTHSDFKPLSATPFFNAKGRVGLSKRTSIPSLLRKVDRNKEAPKVIERKEKLNKRQLEEREAERIAKEEAEAEGREYVPLDQLRGKDGRLIEWDF